jgi:hypothetical protein
MPESEPVRSQNSAENASDWSAINDALRGLRFGVVSIIVQDGVIVQIDRTEKRRFRRKSQGSAVESLP